MTEVTKIESKYERLRKIGIGSYGVVFKCVNRQSGQIVAIKRYSENDTDPIIRKIAMREVRMLRQLKHPNLIQLIEVFRRKRRLHLVFDYCELTVLDVIDKYASNCPLNLIKKIIWQLVNGVSYCHSRNCIHRDIKPENILINQYGVVKLCDFGFARNLINGNGGGQHHSSSSANSGSGLQYNNSSTSNSRQLQLEQEARLLGVPYNNGNGSGTSSNSHSNGAKSGSSTVLSADKENANNNNNSSSAVGSSATERLALTEYVATRWYRAPELLVGEVYYDTKIDIWAIGCVTAELMRGEPIWPGKTDLDQLFMIMNSLGGLTSSQVRTLMTQKLYDQASTERLLKLCADSIRGGRPTGGDTDEEDVWDAQQLENRLPNRVGPIGLEFVLVCLRIDPEKRPTSEKLLRHPYIHSSRMAQFVKGTSSSSSASATATSASTAAGCLERATNAAALSVIDLEASWPSNVLRPSNKSRSNSEALILAANQSGPVKSNREELPMVMSNQQQQMVMKLQQQQHHHHRRKSPSESTTTLEAHHQQATNKRHPLESIASIGTDDTGGEQESPPLLHDDEADSQKLQHKRKKPPQTPDNSKSTRNVATGEQTSARRQSLVPISSSRLNKQPNNPLEHANVRSRQQQQRPLIQLPAVSDSAASSSSNSTTNNNNMRSFVAGKSPSSRAGRLSQSNGNLMSFNQQRQIDDARQQQRQSTTNINSPYGQQQQRTGAYLAKQTDSPMRTLAKNRADDTSYQSAQLSKYSTPTRVYNNSNQTKPSTGINSTTRIPITPRRRQQQQQQDSSASSSSIGAPATSILSTRLSQKGAPSLYH